MLPTRTLVLVALAHFAPLASAQFNQNTADIPGGSPGNASVTENVDFGDVDQDGDWDAVFADGGDPGLDQNRIWINQGGAQAGVEGVFLDETVARFPALNDQSRDVEFADFDNDSDLDLHISNTSSLVNASNRFWRNTGNGFFVDETSTRFIGLGQAGSSVPPSQVLPSGGFIDYSGDCDFADLDNDGDLDLFHSSYGGAMGGMNPSRVFLNDGTGVFQEFNPSGFQFPWQTISDGDPALWCEGIQQSNTTNTDGSFADIASSTLDIELGDIDGDFDIDVLQGALQEQPRLFVNRLEENQAPGGSGALSFRDRTHAQFPANWTVGSGHYEQEMGDLDGDGDLDIFGLNWQQNVNFFDATLRNDGSGNFDDVTVLPASGADDNEGDFIDFDNDGDLDIFVANFSGQDRLYENSNNGGASFGFTLASFPPSTNNAVDADTCDVDGDGDYDLFVANEFNQANGYYENVSQVPDTHAPYIPNLEQAPDRAPGAAPTIIRAQVYDNAPYYITWYNATTLSYSVDGGSPTVVPMRSSGGQIFRGEIPGGLVGQVDYFVSSSDHYGNSGQSATRSYQGEVFGSVGTPFCFGDGSGAPCPCGNVGANSSGCANGSGVGANLAGSGSASVAEGDLVLSATGLALNTPGVYFEGKALVGGSVGIVFGDGLRCAGGQLTRIQVRVANGVGQSMTSVNVPQKTGALAGDLRYYQLMYRDPAGSPCGAGFNISQGLQISWLP